MTLIIATLHDHMLHFSPLQGQVTLCFIMIMLQDNYTFHAVCSNSECNSRFLENSNCLEQGNVSFVWNYYNTATVAKFGISYTCIVSCWLR